MPTLIRQTKPKKTIILIVYSELHFQAFYQKHCGRGDTLSPEYTVIVIGEEDHPRKKHIRRAFEEKNTGRNFLLQENQHELFLLLPPPFMARKYNGLTDEWIDKKPGEGTFRINGCKKLKHRKDIDYLLRSGELNQKDIYGIDSIKEYAKNNNLTIKFIWYIGHIDVVKLSR